MRHLFYVGYLVVFVLSSFYGLFHYWKSEKEDSRQIAAKRLHWNFAKAESYGISDELKKNLGWVLLPSTRTSHFKNFPEDKKPGTLRIGFFGDSFIWGGELQDTQDPPFKLQRELEKRLPHPVEVLNFGVSAYGLSQSLLLWKEFQKKYNIDITIFRTATFWINRDQTFYNSWAGTIFHARYILGKDGGLQLISPPGNTPSEMLDNYYQWIPYQSYLRFSRRSPPFLQALILSDGIIPNPFYYTSLTPNEEQIELEVASLLEIGKGSNQVLAMREREFHNDKRLTNIAQLYEDQYRTLYNDFKHDYFLYRAPQGHPSAWENSQTVVTLADYLLGEKQSLQKRVHVTPTPSKQELRLGAQLVGHTMLLKIRNERIAHAVPRTIKNTSNNLCDSQGFFLQASKYGRVLLPATDLKIPCRSVIISTEGKQVQKKVPLMPVTVGYEYSYLDFCDAIISALNVQSCVWKDKKNKSGKRINVFCAESGDILASGRIKGKSVEMHVPPGTCKWASGSPDIDLPVESLQNEEVIISVSEGQTVVEVPFGKVNIEDVEIPLRNPLPEDFLRKINSL